MAERASRTNRGTGPVETAPETAGAGGTETSTGPAGPGRVDAEATGAGAGAEPTPGGASATDGSAGPNGRTPTTEPSSHGSANQGAPGHSGTGAGTADGSWSPHPRGLDPGEVRSRWNETQGRFIDDPQQAVREADALASEVAKAVVAEIESRRSALRSAWSDGDSGSGSASGDTETLRVSLRDYRTFVQRLIGENAQ